MLGKKKETFRKAALEQLASPERLDEMMVVTSPKGWVALSTCGLLLALVVLWSVVGRIPERVMAQGILIPGGSTLEVQSEVVGRIVEFMVKEGDEVKADQAVAKINVEGQDFDLDLLQQKLERDMKEHERKTADENGQRDAEMRSLQVQRVALESERINLKTAYANAQGSARNGREMLPKGGVSAVELKNRELAEATAQAAVEEVEGRFAKLDADALSFSNQLRALHDQREQDIADLKDQIKRQSRERERSSEVKAPFSGKVYEVSLAEGSRVGERDVVMRLERLDEELSALLYVLSESGKKVDVGQPVYLAPDSVKKEEFGSLVGAVQERPNQPASRNSMLKDLGNAVLVDQFLGRGAVFRVKTTLVTDGGTFSGYKWTSGKGPEVKIISGTGCSATIVVGEKRPIDFVIPIFKELVKGS